MVKGDLSGGEKRDYDLFLEKYLPLMRTCGLSKADLDLLAHTRVAQKSNGSAGSSLFSRHRRSPERS